MHANNRGKTGIDTEVVHLVAGSVHLGHHHSAGTTSSLSTSKFGST